MNPIISREDYPLPLSLAHERKCKQNKQAKTAQISPYTKLTQTPGQNLEGQKPKGRKNSTLSLGKGDLKHNKLKKLMKRQRNTTQMKEQTRNTEDQIN